VSDLIVALARLQWEPSDSIKAMLESAVRKYAHHDSPSYLPESLILPAAKVQIRTSLPFPPSHHRRTAASLRPSELVSMVEAWAKLTWAPSGGTWSIIWEVLGGTPASAGASRAASEPLAARMRPREVWDLLYWGAKLGSSPPTRVMLLLEDALAERLMAATEVRMRLRVCVAISEASIVSCAPHPTLLPQGQEQRQQQQRGRDGRPSLTELAGAMQGFAGAAYVPVSLLEPVRMGQHSPLGQVLASFKPSSPGEWPVPSLASCLPSCLH
jgi:hypothetical protein